MVEIKTSKQIVEQYSHYGDEGKFSDKRWVSLDELRKKLDAMRNYYESSGACDIDYIGAVSEIEDEFFPSPVKQDQKVFSTKEGRAEASSKVSRLTYGKASALPKNNRRRSK